MLDTDYADLKAIAEKLARQCITDANPENWSGHGKIPSQMDEETRGDAYWCRKVAGQTLSVLTKVMSVTGAIERATKEGGSPEEPGDSEAADLRKRVAEAKRKATRLLKLVPGRPNASA